MSYQPLAPTTREVKLQLLRALESIQTHGPVRETWGLCPHINHMMAYYHAFPAVEDLRGRWSRWPRYSGLMGCPVPGPEGMDPGHAYRIINNKWDRNTEYGQARWELLAWLIEDLEKEAAHGHA